MHKFSDIMQTYASETLNMWQYSINLFLSYTWLGSLNLLSAVQPHIHSEPVTAGGRHSFKRLQAINSHGNI